MKIQPLFDPEKPTLFVYHGYCNDGLTSVAIAKHHYVNVLKRDDFSILGGVHQVKPTIDLFQDKTVVFLDFCYPLDVVKQILEVADSVTVIDHHVSAYEEMKDFSHKKLTYIYNVSKCGAMMAWDIYYRGKECPLFVKCINDRDLWLNKAPSSEFMSLALRTEFSDSLDFISLVCDVIDEWLEQSSQKTTYQLIKRGSHYKKYHDIIVKRLMANAFEITLDDGQKAMKCYTPMEFASDVGSRLAERYTGVALIAQQYANHIQYSIRVAKNCDYDASVYAKSKGGGGHKKASGYRESV